MSYTPLPIGVDDFEDIITKKYYYVDKTWLIKELLDKGGKVNLFTRPRRFGKTLNMSMLRYFFEKPVNDKSNKYLFEGMRIMNAGEQYTSKQEQYPVISLTLKSAKQASYKVAFHCLKDEIIQEFRRHEELLKSDKLEAELPLFKKIYYDEAEDTDYVTALKFLSLCLAKHYEQKVIILIDEYDVPLENAYYTGFYEEMIAFIRSLFESALKTNPYLEFAVITGCLWISKESIFTGLNNLEIISILNKDYTEHFGFIEEEVKEMLDFYERANRMNTMKEWYDGYRFGDTEVYNPWSVINYVKNLVSDENAFPTAAWSNTSSNSIVRDLIYRADKDVKDEIELLMKGATIEKKVHEDITYGDIYESEDNLWNFLFFTGYLKQVSMRMDGVNRYVTMAIPNNELIYIYENTIENWFRDEIKQKNLSLLYDAMQAGDVGTVQKEIETQLRSSISYMDSAESFYHGFLLGLLANLSEYSKKSNREAGDGRYDIAVYTEDVELPPIIFELKVAGKYKDLEEMSKKALNQIKERKYAESFAEWGYTEVICYGVAFFRKQIKMTMERVAIEED